MPYIIAAVSGPFLGFYVDKHGHYKEVTLLGSFIMLCAHTLTICIPDCN